MSFAFVVFYSAFLMIAAFAAAASGWVIIYRRRGLIPGGLTALRPSIDVRALAHDPVLWALGVADLSLLLPWFEGSVGVVGLNRTAFGLSYASWWLIPPVLAASLLAALLPRERSSAVNAVTLVLTFWSVCAGSVTLIALDAVDHVSGLATLAEQIVTDAGYGDRLQHVQVTASVGLAPYVFTLGTLASAWLAALRFRRHDTGLPVVPVEFAPPTQNTQGHTGPDSSKWTW
jgi:hypothetical protein